MKVFHELSGTKIEFSVLLDEGEFDGERKYSGVTEFYFDFGDLNPSSIHPDKIALVAILNLLPFAKKSIELMWGVSERFTEACKLISRVKILSDEENIVAHSMGSLNEIPCISFSGGADSTAALAVMPKITECVFLLRRENSGKTLYDSDAAKESCRKLTRLGYNVHMVETDLEFLRDPLGFPTDLAVGSPAILLSDVRHYSSIAYGTILESAFGTSGARFRSYSDSSHYKLWSSLFDAAGLGYSLPVAGVSEVGSTLICENHALGKVHQSCIRGKWGQPCKNCWKCFRKNAIIAAIRGSKVKFDYIENIVKSKEVRMKIFNEAPIKHEGVLTYCIAKEGASEGEAMELLSDLVRVGKIPIDWMEKWYSGSDYLIHESYRDEVVKNLERILGAMRPEDEESLNKWENSNNEEREKILHLLEESLF